MKTRATKQKLVIITCKSFKAESNHQYRYLQVAFVYVMTLELIMLKAFLVIW